MDCEQVEKELEAYALGALESEEAAEVAAHLANCQRCRTLADAYAEVAAMLPAALAVAAPVELPPSLKGRLLERLPERAPSANGRGADTAAAFPVARRGSARGMRLALVAACVLLILAVAWSVRLQVTLARERSLRAEFAQLVDRQEVVLEVIDSNRTQRRVLRSPSADSRAYGKLFTRDDLVHVVAMAARLTPPPDGQGYHLWVTLDGTTSLAGVLNVNDEGFGLILFDDAQPGPSYERAEVTLQPLGSDSPAGSIILRWVVE